MRAIKYLAFASIFLLLTGCAAPPVVPAELPPDDAAQIKLAEAATSVSHSLEQLAAMEKAVHPSIKLPAPPNPTSIGMAQLASVDWNGPVEPLIRKIAAATHYRVRVLGRPLAIPPLVSISAKNTPLADILRDASFQVAKKADIIIYPRSHVIEIRYLGT